MVTDKIFWREKGTKQWRSGWIVGHDGDKIQIGSYIYAHWGVWYDKEDIELEERR